MRNYFSSRHFWLGGMLLIGGIAALWLTSGGRAAQQSPTNRNANSATTPVERTRRSAAATPTPRPAVRVTPTPPATPRPTATPDRRDPREVMNDAPPVMSTPRPTPAPTLKPTPSPEEEAVDPGDVIRVNTSLVNLNVRVIDRNNRPIGNLRQEDFKVYENGVLQPVQFFSQEEVPISYGLAIDTSGSLRTQLLQVIEAGKTIISSNKPGDETFLMRFISSDQIETKLDFSSNKEELLESIDDLYISGGQTAVVDAVYLGAEHVAEYRKTNDANDRRRRALIVISDGEDRGSFYKDTDLFERLREEDVQIFTIGFVSELDKDGGFIRKSDKDKAVGLLKRMAEETGGRAFFPTSPNDLPDIAREIVRAMRTQYVVGYSPTNTARDGSYRAIRVTVTDGSNREKRIALTRSGRVAGNNPNAPAGAPARPGNLRPRP